MNPFFALLALAANLVVIVGVTLWLAGRVSPAAAARYEQFAGAIREYALWFAAAVAITSMLGSLYYSEIADFTPCRFCWYQRIAMYPLALILTIAAVRDDRSVRRYGVPLAVGGAGLAIYHYLLQQFPSLDAGGCSISAPCSAAYVWQFDFVSIPYMALSGFALILLLLGVAGSGREGAD